MMRMITMTMIGSWTDNDPHLMMIIMTNMMTMIMMMMMMTRKMMMMMTMSGGLTANNPHPHLGARPVFSLQCTALVSHIAHCTLHIAHCIIHCIA